MIEINNENLKNAIAKAKATKPKVRILQFRTYLVTNGDGVTYTVKFAKIGNRPHGECDCKATRACYHIAAAIDIHLTLAAQMQTA